MYKKPVDNKEGIRKSFCFLVLNFHHLLLPPSTPPHHRSRSSCDFFFSFYDQCFSLLGVTFSGFFTHPVIIDWQLVIVNIMCLHGKTPPPFPSKILDTPSVRQEAGSGRVLTMAPSGCAERRRN